MRKPALILAAVLGLAAAASAQQASPAPDDMKNRLIERPSDAALEGFMKEQQRTAPGFIDRFDGPVGENLKIHSAISRNLMGSIGSSWIPDGKAVSLDIAVTSANGATIKTRTLTIQSDTSMITTDAVNGRSAPYVHMSLSADVLRDRIVEADVLATIDGKTVLLQDVKLRSGVATEVKAASGDTYTVTATIRDQTGRERSSRERMQTESITRQLQQRNDWDAANPNRPFQYPTGGGRRYTPEELEARRRPPSAEEDAFVAGGRSEIPDGYVVEASETLTLADVGNVPIPSSVGFDDLIQFDLVNLPSGRKYASATRYRASRDGTIAVDKIMLLDGKVVAQPSLTAKSGETINVTIDGLTYQAVFTLRQWTANERRTYEPYKLGHRSKPDPDTLPPGVDPRPKRGIPMSRTVPPDLPLLARDGQAVSLLLPRISDEEQDKQQKAELEEFRANPPVGMSKAEIETMLRSPPPEMSRLQRARMVMFEYSWTLSQNMPPPRSLPTGKLLETTVWAQLPAGEQLGPFRMYNSSALSVDSMEAADGMFGSDGDERFVGSMLGSASADGTVEMTFAMVIDRQPLMVSGARAKSGEAAAYITDGGYRLVVKPVLREPNWFEQRNIEARAASHVHQSIATRLRGPPEPMPDAPAVPAPAPAR